MLSPVLSALPVLPYCRPNRCATALSLAPLQMRELRHRAVKYLAQSDALVSELGIVLRQPNATLSASRCLTSFGLCFLLDYGQAISSGFQIPRL